MAEPEAGEGSSTQLQATLGTVLEAIRGIQRSNRTTVEAMDSEVLRREARGPETRAIGEAGKSMRQTVAENEGKGEVPIQKERK